MKMKIIICTIVFLLTGILFQEAEKSIVGKWECYHRELEDGTIKGTDFDGNEFEYTCSGLIIDLKSDLTGWESIGEQKFSYKLKDSILRLGNRFYIVELLNEKELTLKDYKPDGISINNFRQKFKKIE